MCPCEWCAGNESGWRSALEAVTDALEALRADVHRTPTFAQAIQDAIEAVEKLKEPDSE